MLAMLTGNSFKRQWHQLQNLKSTHTWHMHVLATDVGDEAFDYCPVWSNRP